VSADPLVGQVIAGRYQVLGPIGKGGMGAIYEVRHLKLQRSFALKRLSPQLADDTEALARFRREAEVVGRLRHPNVVEVVDWESLPDGTPCIILELLRGEDLDHRLERAGPLEWVALLQIADAVLGALEVAHRAGIVHRDLKPQNIFLATDDAGEEHVKLLDFGVSKVHGSDSLHTADQRLVGTPAYMSPEQADGRQDLVDAATDAWAMGGILYEMATARVAFAASSTPATLYRICHGRPEPLTALRPDAPAAFVELVDAAISREPSRRIRSAGELRRRLRAALTPIAGNALPAVLRPLPPAETPPPSVSPSLAHATTLSSAASQHGGAIRRRTWPLSIVVGATGVALAVVVAVVVVARNPTPAPVALPPPPRPSPPQVMPVVRPLAPSGTVRRHRRRTSPARRRPSTRDREPEAFVSYDITLADFPSVIDPVDFLETLDEAPRTGIDREPLVVRLLALNPALRRSGKDDHIEVSDESYRIQITLFDNSINVRVALGAPESSDECWRRVGLYINAISAETGYKAYDHQFGDFWEPGRG
jgi:serine/threonine-protein kinase